jgi:transcriptional antiterminator
MNYPSTRTELAELYGVSRKTLYNWLKMNNIELSKGYLPPKEVEKIFEIFGKPDGINA